MNNRASKIIVFYTIVFSVILLFMISNLACVFLACIYSLILLISDEIMTTKRKTKNDLKHKRRDNPYKKGREISTFVKPKSKIKGANSDNNSQLSTNTK